MIALEVKSPSTSNLLALASGVPIGQSGIVHTWGRNDMSTSQILMFRWTVWDPDGLLVLEDTDKTLFGVPPGGTEERMTPRFDLDKEGTYTLKADLLMNPDNPVIVDSYEGDLCTVTLEVPPEYELLEHTIYPYAYVYDGDDETAIFTCSTDPFTPSAWVAGKLAAEVEKEVKDRGSRMIELKVYVDKSPLLWTDWRIEATATPLPGIAAAQGIGAIAIPIWAAILIACLAIAALIIVITWAVETIVGTFTHKPLSPEIKATWSRESLISCINDFEVKLELTPTPGEELEQMSDQELRDYCDQLAEEIVPPEVAWLPLAIVGGLAVLGVGAAIALAARRE